MGDTEQVEREVEHLRVVITRLGSVQPEGQRELPIVAPENCVLNRVTPPKPFDALLLSRTNDHNEACCRITQGCCCAHGVVVARLREAHASCRALEAHGAQFSKRLLIS